MKLHLPYRLYRALLTVLAAIPTWIYATPAAAIPEGYTAHNVSTVKDVTTYSGDDKQAFLLEQDLIFDNSHTFKTSLFFTSADEENLVSLTFQNYYYPRVWEGESGRFLTLQGLSVITIQNNQGNGKGGCLRNSIGGNVLVKDNGSVSFSGNYSTSDGGAIRNSGTITINGNGSVLFGGNDSDSGYGDAIYNDSGTITINSNDRVSFNDNSSDIYSKGGGQLDIANNGTVIFRGNQGSGLRFSAGTTSSKLTLSARPGGSIKFYNSVYVSKTDEADDFQVSYNQIFEDEQGQHAQTGDIVFVGKNSSVLAMSNLYDGRLIMKDGVVYEGQGITVHSSVSGASTPTLRLGNGQLRHSGYVIAVESGAALELAGVNTVTASSLTMQDGSRLNVYVGTEHADESALTLTGNWELGGTLDIHFQTDETALASGSYRLLTLASGQTPESWTTDRITVSGLGATFDDLTWNGSTLYLNYTALTEATWTNESGDKLWGMGSSINWAQNKRHHAYQDGVKVVFGDVGAGEVILAGELAPSSVLVENSAGRDYVWAAGASVVMRGGTLTVDDTTMVNATGGQLVLTDGTLSGSLTDTTLSANNGNINATFTGNNTITGNNYALTSVLSNNGTLTLSGTFDASALALNSIDSALIGVDGTVGTSGFRLSGGVSVAIATGTTVNDHATITHGDYTLTLGADGIATAAGSTDYSTYHLTGTDAATTSAIHGVSANATVSMNGGTLTVDDVTSVDATGGALELTDGALSGTLSGTSLTAKSGDIDATFTGNNSIIGNDYALTSVLDNNGTLTLSGTFDASGLTLETTEATHIDTMGQSGTSGFAQAAAYSVTLATGTTANAGASITHGDVQLTLGTDGTATAGGAVDYSTYYLSGTDTATTSAIHGVSGAENATVSMDGGTLTVDDAATVYATGGHLSLEGGDLSGTIAHASLTAHDGRIHATLTGQTSLLVDGGTVALAGGNSHSGGSVISGGSVVLNGRGALGIGDVSLRGGKLDLGGHQLDVSGSLTLAGGGLVYRGEQLVVRATEGVVFEGGTTIEVSPGECQHGQVLADFGDTRGYSEGCLTLIGAGEDWALSFDEASGMLTLLNTALPVVDSVRAGLDGNQSGVYGTLEQIAADGTVSGELGNLAERVLGAGSSAGAAALLDRVGGASLATAMNSQLEGNLAHLRRLRQNIGSGQSLALHVPAGQASVASSQDVKVPLAAPTYLPRRMSAYVNAYNSDHTLSADGSGSGMRRTEWGGVLGMEGQISESLTLGASLSAGRAKIEPTNDARYHEETAHVDLYAVAGSGKGWQSVTSVGVGFHSFDFRRHYLDGRMATADGVDGFSFNAMEEVNYTFEVSEQTRLQPFLAVQTSVNRIDSFSESGAGNASLQGESRDAWATDLTLGARYLSRFSAISHAQDATLSLQAGVTASVGDVTADLPLRFQGAAEEAAFIARSARGNRWGCNVEASLSLPVTEDMAVFAAGGAILRGDLSEANAQLGVRISF